MLLRGVIVAACAVGAMLGNPVIRAVLRRIDPARADGDPDVRRARENLGLLQQELPGGRWVGMLERLAVFVCIVAGFPAGIAVVLGVKGLGRYAELASELPDFHAIGRLAEYRYFNMDQVVARALKLADRLLAD